MPFVTRLDSLQYHSEVKRAPDHVKEFSYFHSWAHPIPFTIAADIQHPCLCSHHSKSSHRLQHMMVNGEIQSLKITLYMSQFTKLSQYNEYKCMLLKLTTEYNWKIIKNAHILTYLLFLCVCVHEIMWTIFSVGAFTGQKLASFLEL